MTCTQVTIPSGIQVHKLHRGDEKVIHELRLRPDLSGHNIGKGTYAASNFQVFSWGEGTKLSIGNYCSISSDVKILLGGEHRSDWVTTYPFSVLDPHKHHIGHPQSKGNVTIGHDVWIAMGASILSGVTIGNGAIIAAFSNVTKDVPPYAVVGGNPAKLIRKRFDDHVIQALEQISWWSWEDDKISEAMPYLLNQDIERFIELYN